MARGVGKYNRRIRLEQKTETVDGDGDRVIAWTTFQDGVRAEIVTDQGPQRGEYVAASSILSGGAATINIPWRAGVLETMRVVHPADSNKIYEIKSVIPDSKTGREQLSLVCVWGLNEG